MKYLIALLALIPLLSFAEKATLGEPPVKAPFVKGEDSLCVNDWWNRKDNPIIDLKVPRDEVVCFGMYTVHDDILKLNAQLYPLYPNETRTVRLEVKKWNGWKEIARQEVNDIGWSTVFRIEDWNSNKNIRYRLLHGEEAGFEGIIRKDPKNKDVITLASLNCNSSRDRGLREEYIRNINHQDPDLLFFAGDQSYDHREHTAAWLKFGLQFRDIFRNRPCIAIPDDHDVGQANIWGEGGKVAQTSAGPSGGYFFHPKYVNMVQRQQTGHLPDAYDPTPIQQDITVYYTNLILGGVDFAIIEDRKFKTGPKGRHPHKGPRPDHIRDPNYDPKTIDVPGLELLGERQEKFLEDWSQQQNGVAMKAVLSQTGFCGGAHLHGTVDNRLHADLDSNGWPQSGRNRALELIKQAGAVHIGGDQHLATVIHHGINEHGDGPYAFIAPAIVNTIYGRWWWPEEEQAGANPVPDSPLPWTGEYLDGFGNKIRMIAYANPAVIKGSVGKVISEPGGPNLADGWGIVKFKKSTGEVTFECWPRWCDVTQPGAEQFPGWPITVKP